MCARLKFPKRNHAMPKRMLHCQLCRQLCRPSVPLHGCSSSNDQSLPGQNTFCPNMCPNIEWRATSPKKIRNNKACWNYDKWTTWGLGPARHTLKSLFKWETGSFVELWILWELLMALSFGKGRIAVVYGCCSTSKIAYLIGVDPYPYHSHMIICSIVLEYLPTSTPIFGPVM